MEGLRTAVVSLYKKAVGGGAISAHSSSVGVRINNCGLWLPFIVSHGKVSGAPASANFGPYISITIHGYGGHTAIEIPISSGNGSSSGSSSSSSSDSDRSSSSDNGTGSREGRLKAVARPRAGTSQRAITVMTPIGHCRAGQGRGYHPRVPLVAMGDCKWTGPRNDIARSRPYACVVPDTRHRGRQMPQDCSK